MPPAAVFPHLLSPLSVGRHTLRNRGTSRVLEVDNVVICAGQDPDDRLPSELRAVGVECHVIGGARHATELDAARAIDEGTRLAQRL
jgi:2,4-dienoyl-CoA reductase (NADPH2)